MKSILSIIFLLSVLILGAQDKNSSLGLRGGGLSGMTYKFVDQDFKAVELILGYQKGGMRLTGIVQKFTPVGVHRIANLFVYSGLGAHAGYVQFDERKTKTVDGIEYYSYQKVYSPVVGADIVIGLEYQFESVPFNICLDYKPYMEFFGEKLFRMDFWDIGFSLRYRINN
ncbi:MAG: hypothetical protein R2764_07370 [Bacteroidales bacterium]